MATIGQSKMIKETSLSDIIKLVAYIAIALSVGLIAYISYQNSNPSLNLKEEFQAVFLTTGQVYFGQVKARGADFTDLENIYYLKSSSELNTSVSDSTNISLIKLGNEVHGPTDRMVINNNQILFIEDLKNDSKVVLAIKDYQNK